MFSVYTFCKVQHLIVCILVFNVLHPLQGAAQDRKRPENEK